MLEKKIEKTVIDNLKDALDGLDVHYIGVWQTEDDKASESAEMAVIAVKAFPRSYETPTIPYASIQVEVSLAVRSDIDCSGMKYDEISEKIQDVLQTWQKTFDASHTAFSIENEFDETGFQLDGGDCGLDRESKVWQFTQSFTIYGIIL